MILDKVKTSTYKIGSFPRGRDKNFNFITLEGEHFIPITLQRYILNYKYAYIFHPVMFRTETMIFRYAWHWISHPK